MNTQHTPKPWRISEHDDGTIVGPRAGQSSPIVAVMPVWFTGKKPGEHATQDHQRANARLIAAAPELLDALQAILYWCQAPGSRPDPKRPETIARAAIARATGNTIPSPFVSENLNQPLGIEADSICPKTGKRHVPDWPSVSVQWDGGEAYIDANCRDCGRSGWIGTSESLSSMVNW